MGSSQLKVVIRADASVSIGMGHRVRSEVLAEAFIKHGANVRFVVHGSCSDFTKTEDFLYQDELQWHELARQADILVLDHYGYDADAINELFKLNPNLLVLDDNNNRGVFLLSLAAQSSLPFLYAKCAIPFNGRSVRSTASSISFSAGLATLRPTETPAYIWWDRPFKINLALY